MNNKQIVENYLKENRNYKESWATANEDLLGLLDLIDKFKIKTIFEMGTWKGFTAGLMLKKDVKIKAIDINKDMCVWYYHKIHPKRDKSNYGKYCKGNENYELVFCNSLKYNPKGEEFDMIFIDANHNYKHTKRNTELARKFNPKIIVWHDYPNEKGVKKYIDELISKGHEIICLSGSLSSYEICKAKQENNKLNTMEDKQ